MATQLFCSYVVVRFSDTCPQYFNILEFLPSRPGERYAYALTSMNLPTKVQRLYGSIQLKDYVKT